MTVSRCDWTDADHRLAVELAWHSGYENALWGPGFPARLAAIDEVRALETQIERLTPEQQYQRRRAEIDAGALRAAADMASAAARNRAHDVEVRHAGGEHSACDPDTYAAGRRRQAA